MSLRDKLWRCPDARGLAIIITNDYTTTPRFPHKLTALPGTRIDGENLKETFEALGFVVHWKHNQVVGRQQLVQLMYEVKQLKHSKVKHYLSIVLVFSGHGIAGNHVHLQNGNTIHICDQLIKPLLPEQAPEIGNVPKLFFIDACRGNEVMKSVVVPKGARSATSQVEARGGELNQLRVPPEGNFLVAYSTLPEYKAYERPENGGIWLSILARKLKEGYDMSVEDVLTDVNEELLKMSQSPSSTIQQPERISRLNKIVKLLPADDGLPTTCGEDGAAVKRKRTMAAFLPGASNGSGHGVLQSQQPPVHVGNHGIADVSPASIQVHHQEQFQQVQGSPTAMLQGNFGHVVPAKQQEQLSDTLRCSSTQYQTMLCHCAQELCDSPPNYRHTVHFEQQYNQHYYGCTVELLLRNGERIQADSGRYFLSQQDSQEAAAKNACDMIGKRRVQQPPIPFLPHSANGVPSPHHQPMNCSSLVHQYPQAAAVSPSNKGASIKGVPPSGNSRQQLNHFFQLKGVTRPKEDYIADNTTGQPRYRCTLSYFMNGKTEHMDSGGYFPSKGEAKERAARRVLKKEGYGEIKGEQLTPLARGGNTADSKLWKSKLKEYYDQKLKLNPLIKYDTFPTAGGFQSVVHTDDLPSGVKGEVCKSKKEAEQSAAQRALQTLKSGT